MKKYFGVLVILACTFSLSLSAFARPKSCSAQINFLNKFLKLENAGGRLKSQGRIYSMISDDSQWETATVIKSYNLESCDLTSGDAKITVSFQVLGTMASSPTGEPDFIQETKVESVDFNVIKNGRRWKISDLGDFRPHVSSWVAAHSINPADGQIAKRSIASLKARKSKIE